MIIDTRDITCHLNPEWVEHIDFVIRRINYEGVKGEGDRDLWLWDDKM